MDEKKRPSHSDSKRSQSASVPTRLLYNVPMTSTRAPELNGIDANAIESSRNRLSSCARRTPYLYVNLNFNRLQLEQRFRKHLQRQFSTQLVYLHVALAIFSAIAILEISGGLAKVDESGKQETYYQRLGFTLGSFAALLAAIVTSRFIPPHQGQLTYAILYCVYGCLAAAADVTANDTLDANTSAVFITCFLVAYHLLGKTFLFKFMSSTTGIVNVVYIILAPSFRNDEHFSITVFQVLSVVITSLFLCYSTHRYEVRARRSFLVDLKAQHDKAKLEQEKNILMEGANRIREDIYKKLIEKFDTPKVDISSPAQMMLRLLKKLQEQVRLPPRAFQMVNKIITILGTSNDIFKPQIKRQKERKSTSTFGDVHNWILDLVQNGGGNENLHSRGGSSQMSLDTMGTRASISPALVTPEVKARNELLSHLDEFDFDLFEVDTFTRGQPLLLITITLFQRYGFIRKYNIDPIKLKNFVTEIESGYAKVPYHNSIHAADVVRTTHYFLKIAKLDTYMKPLEMMATLVAAAIHDFEHPGTNNNFLIATKHEYAMTYNDRSVLENHHVAAAYRVLMKPSCDIFSALKREQRMAVRKHIIQVVLSTDLAKHFEEVGKFSTSVASGKINKEDPAARLMILKIMVKCGDLGHTTKKLEQHKRWTLRITEEMFTQGDLEKKNGNTPSPYMDREVGKNIAKSQLNFLKYIVEPMFSVFINFLNNDSKMELPHLKQLGKNLAYWTAEADRMRPDSKKNMNSRRSASTGTRRSSGNSTKVPRGTSDK